MAGGTPRRCTQGPSPSSPIYSPSLPSETNARSPPQIASDTDTDSHLKRWGHLGHGPTKVRKEATRENPLPSEHQREGLPLRMAGQQFADTHRLQSALPLPSWPCPRPSLRNYWLPTTGKAPPCGPESTTDWKITQKETSAAARSWVPPSPQYPPPFPDFQYGGGDNPLQHWMARREQPQLVIGLFCDPSLRPTRPIPAIPQSYYRNHFPGTEYAGLQHPVARQDLYGEIMDSTPLGTASQATRHLFVKAPPASSPSPKPRVPATHKTLGSRLEQFHPMQVRTDEEPAQPTDYPKPASKHKGPTSVPSPTSCSPKASAKSLKPKDSPIPSAQARPMASPLPPQHNPSRHITSAIVPAPSGHTTSSTPKNCPGTPQPAPKARAPKVFCSQPYKVSLLTATTHSLLASGTNQDANPSTVPAIPMIPEGCTITKAPDATAPQAKGQLSAPTGAAQSKRSTSKRSTLQSNYEQPKSVAKTVETPTENRYQAFNIPVGVGETGQLHFSTRPAALGPSDKPSGGNQRRNGPTKPRDTALPPVGRPKAKDWNTKDGVELFQPPLDVGETYSDRFKRYRPEVRAQTLKLMEEDPELLRKSVARWLLALLETGDCSTRKIANILFFH